MAKRGQPGSQSARKQSFYSKVLTEAEKVALEEAKDIQGIDNEIALLRVKLQSLLQKAPNNIQLQVKAANTLARLVRLKYQLSPQARDNLADAISEVLKELGGSLGILQS